MGINGNLYSLNDKTRELLGTYYHRSTVEGVNKVFDEMYRNKKWLIDMFSKHPNWDPVNLRIVFSKDYFREFDAKGIREFIEWVNNIWQNEVIPNREEKIDGMTYKELCNYSEETEQLRDFIRLFRKMNHLDLGFDFTNTSKVGEQTLADMKMQLHERRCRQNEIDQKYGQYYNGSQYRRYNNMFITKDSYDEINNMSNFFDYFRYKTNYTDRNRLTQDILDEVGKLVPNVRTGVGTTITKFFQKVFSQYPEIRDYLKVETKSWVDPNTGEYHERQKNITLQSKIAELGDKISPLTIRRHTIISLNPLDYLTMSFLHGCASCHTIDKENQRGADSRNHYSGEYCSGTLSYMLDPSTVIFYTVDSEYNGTDFETQDKMQRCTFSIGYDGDLMIQGRVYPDGRDGGDKGLSKQFREVMQQVISDCTEKPNFWTLKKGTTECTRYSESTGTHYRDYEQYSDCTVSIRQNADFGTSQPKVKIGHCPIDPETGEEHRRSSSINKSYDGKAGYERWLRTGESEDDYVVEECERCGREINTDYDNYIRDEDTGDVYCCEGCAWEAGVERCEDDGNWHSEFYRDDYDDYCYSGDPYIETEDGHCYSDSINAERDGYGCDDEGNWYPVDEIYYDDINCYSFHETDEMVIIGDHYFEDEERAEDAGYHYIDSIGEWVDEDDLINIDGDWFLTDDCVLTETDGWQLEEDCTELDDGRWYLSENVVESALYGILIYREDAIAIIDDEYFSSEEELHEAGYVFSEDQCAWVKADTVTENNEESEVA